MSKQMDDPFGLALIKYYTGSCLNPVFVQAQIRDMKLRPIPVDMFFDPPEQFPEIDKIALRQCQGRVLDVGAGVGRFALPLQEQGTDVVAIEKQPEAAKIMRKRGVRDVRTVSLEKFLEVEKGVEQFDTILMIMNGIGIVGTLAKLEEFLQKIKPFLRPGGQILADSMNVKRSTYNDFAPHIAIQEKHGNYVGEIQLTFAFEGITGAEFTWVHIDEGLLTKLASKYGWDIEILYRGDDGSYLFRLKQISS